MRCDGLATAAAIELEQRAVENAEIARVLNEVAALLEIEEANAFRVRAYRSAARFIGEYSQPLERPRHRGQGRGSA